MRYSLMLPLWLAAVAALAASPSNDDLLNDATTTNEITTYGGYNLQRHSPLTQINKSNVKRLVPVWNLSLANNYPQEGQPLLIDGVMYETTTDATVAIDPLTGRQIWRTPVPLPQDVHAVVCCGSHNRGAAAYNGLLFRGTLDAHVIALDMKTGKEVWRQKAAEYIDGYSMTGAPLVANGVLITGISGGEYGTRGFLDGWDPATGEKLWRRYTTAAPDEPGGESWAGSEAYLVGGAPTWITGSYDAELDLVYWGTGNGGPWNPSGPREGDNLFINCALALKPKTGEIVWYFQFSPNDPYDYDGVNELVMADLTIDGEPRKVVMQANRNGYFYILDRVTGELLAANPFVDRINWAKGIDMETGRPIDTEVTAMVRKTPEMDESVEIWPSALGGKNWMPMSYDPKRQLAYANTNNFGMPYRTLIEDKEPKTMYLGVEFIGFTFPENGKHGYLKAIDPLTGKDKWRVPSRLPNYSGVLSTEGGIVFSGRMDGEFAAYDSDTGAKLWGFQTGSGITGIPVTWERDGKQYVTVVSGIGGVYTIFSGDPALQNLPPGGSLWTFALFDED
ncbi:MAG: PQQ-dependent dehydrogenase, methanol/ethanol family [Pseudomonadota bacterium]